MVGGKMGRSRSYNGAGKGSATVKKETKSLFGTVGVLVLATLMLFFESGAGQPAKYKSGKAWKEFFEDNWFNQWNTMLQPRINQLVAIVESEGGEKGKSRSSEREPFLVTMVGDSTMMQQHGVVCAFLAERLGRRFDPVDHNDECCVDTLPKTPTEKEGGRGLCFRHAFQRYAEPPGVEQLRHPDVVYFGSGLHFLHMFRKGAPLEKLRVQGWLNYEKDLEDAVKMYRENGRENFRLIFMTSHLIDEGKYKGDFADVLRNFRNNDTASISGCQKQVDMMAQGVMGPEGYGKNEYCRNALMDRNGSEILNRRSRPVMARLGIPLVEGDLIVKDQSWATRVQDGRYYHGIIPVEVWDLFGVLVSPYWPTEIQDDHAQC